MIIKLYKDWKASPDLGYIFKKHSENLFPKLYLACTKSQGSGIFDPGFFDPEKNLILNLEPGPDSNPDFQIKTAKPANN